MLITQLTNNNIQFARIKYQPMQNSCVCNLTDDIRAIAIIVAVQYHAYKYEISMAELP